jgi:hypothetical protein
MVTALSCPVIQAQTADPAPPTVAPPPEQPVAVPSAAPPVDTTPQTPTVPQHTSTTETTPPAAPPPPAAPASAPTPPPGVLARAATAVVENVRIHGILKPTVTFSSAAVESFSNPNASAITAAANPVLANLPDDARLTLQVAQTRFGIWVGEKTPFRAHLEFDFIDFAKSSPTVQALLRLRIASVEWSVTDALVLAAGQDWDLDAPVNAFGVNLVGTQFQSGNHGFMRQQVKALYTIGSMLELGAAIGLPAANSTAKDAAIELGRVPTFALRATALLGKVGRIGVSGIMTRLRFTPGPSERYAAAGIATLFGDLTPLQTLSLRFEGYVGQNVANLGALGIGTGSRASDVSEAGFFVSARQLLAEQHAVFGTYSHARALDVDDVAPSYAYPMSGGALPAFSAATAAGTGTGIRWNQSARLGYEYKPIKGMALAVEGFWYNTHHQLLAVDTARISGRRHALGADLACVYTF